MTTESYRDGDIVVRTFARDDPDRWIVTFDNHSIGAGFDRPGFAEGFLRGNGISAVHVLGRGNDWYQYPGIHNAVATVRATLAGARQIVSYGSSMGGHAAIRFADAVSATAVVALSPQYSNDPHVVPWEHRWRQDARRIAWRADLRGPMACRCRPLILFDPTLPLDRRHAGLIASDTACDLVAMPFAGHPVATYLAETGLLGGIVRAALAGQLDPAAVRREVRLARRGSSVYLGTLAERQPATRLPLALRLGHMATKAAPDGALGMLSLARVLTKASRHDEALALHRDILAITQRASIYLVPYADALFAAGDRRGAAAVADEVVGGLPDIAHLRNWRASLQWHAGLRREAIREQKAAVRLDRGARAYRKRLRRFRWQAMSAALSVFVRQAIGARPG